MATWCGRAGELPPDKPSVHLLVDASVDNSAALWVAAGCEEEGVPLAWDGGSGDADALARAAAARSRLEVGVGLDGAGGAVALAKIPQRAYVVHPGTDRRTLRFLGQAAARLAKGEPLPLEEPPAPFRGIGEGEAKEEWIRSVVEAVLQTLRERAGGRDGSA